MNVRSFGWRDITLLYKYRNRGLFLDSPRLLLYGQMITPVGALTTLLGPSTRSFNYLCKDDSTENMPLFGQVSHRRGSTYAHLSYLAPSDAIDLPELAVLADAIASQMGAIGVFHILADVGEDDQLFELLRKAGFAIYARQCIWRFDEKPAFTGAEPVWRPIKAKDVIGIHSLYTSVVPGLVQQVEPLPKKQVTGAVCYQNGDLQAFVEVKYGPRGIWVQPFVHPDAEGFDQQLVQLLHELPNRRERPVYICIRNYQPWLESAVQGMGAQPGPQQALMVRHLTLARRVKQAFPLPAINGRRVEPTAPIARMDKYQLPDTHDIKHQPGMDSAQ